MKELALACERKSISFYEALAKPGLSIIGEFKKASPSMGKIKMTMELTDRIDEYNESVDAISCLTEEDHFLGNTEYFKEIRKISPLPMIRKDFIIDPYQIYEAKVIGADCILLIAAILSDDQMKVFIFNVIHSMDGENALPKDIKLRAYSIEYSTSSKIYYEEMNDDMKIYVYIDEYTGCIESNSVRLFTELELYKRISQYDYDNNTDKLIEYLHNCKEWEELNSHERKWMSSNFLLQIFVLIFSLMLITMVYKDKNVS